MTRTLALLAGALAATACTEIPLPPPPLFLVPYELSLNATVESLTEIDPTGYCDAGPADCRAWLVNLAEGTPPTRCPIVAIDARFDNGDRYVVWPETIIGTRDQRWNLIGRRHNAPRCHFALVNATRDPR